MNTTPANETYDQRRAREVAEKKARFTAFGVWCGQVATELGGALLAIKKNSEGLIEDWQLVHRDVRLADGTVLNVNLNEWKARVCVSGCWPKSHDGSPLSPSNNLPGGQPDGDLRADSSVTLAEGRDPKAAAKDIARRALPLIRRQYAALLEKSAAYKTTADTIEANAVRLASVLGVKAAPAEHHRRDTYQRTLYVHKFGIYDLAVRVDSAEFKLYLNIAEAEAVLQFVRALTAKK